MKHNLKKILVALLLVVSTCVAGLELYGAIRSATAPYPYASINCYVAWGAGGQTDTVSRALSVYAAEELGVTLIIQNKTGASGSVATEYVKRQRADGYSILFNAENPPLYKVMGISNIDYDDFYPVILAGQQTAALLVAGDSPYQSVRDLFEDARARPGKIRLATTGAGGLTSNVAAMMRSASGLSFNQVPFDGDGPVLTALMGGNADCTVVNYSTAVDYAGDGRVRILAFFAEERLDSAPEVPSICELYPEYESYFPWGTFVGVFVDDDTPPEIKERLSEAFRRGWESEGFQRFLSEAHIFPLGLTGDAARDYIKQWQRVTTWFLYDAGQTQYAPDQFGIERPGAEETEGGTT